MTYDVDIDGTRHRLELSRANGGWECRLDGRTVRIDAVLARQDVLSVIINGKAYEIKRERSATNTHLWVGSARYLAALRDPRSLRGRRNGLGDEHGPQKLIASMPGKVVRVLAPANSQVELGQGVIVVEAMKMQNEIKSPKKGLVKNVLATVGANVNAGDVLAIVE
jgi:biotin carboxyl carrier protein